MERFAHFVNLFFLLLHRFRRPQLPANDLMSLTVSSGRRTIAKRLALDNNFSPDHENALKSCKSACATASSSIARLHRRISTPNSWSHCASAAFGPSGRQSAAVTAVAAR